MANTSRKVLRNPQAGVELLGDLRGDLVTSDGFHAGRQHRADLLSDHCLGRGGLGQHGQARGLSGFEEQFLGAREVPEQETDAEPAAAAQLGRAAEGERASFPGRQQQIHLVTRGDPQLLGGCCVHRNVIRPHRNLPGHDLVGIDL